MKTIAIIPARGGSKRLPNKNTMLLNGLPLLVHSIQYAQNNANVIDEIYVSTDDATIKDIALQYGAKVIDRPEEISGDSEPTLTALQHVLKQVKNVSTVVLLQPTNPLRPVNLLQECFAIFQKKQLNSLFTVTRNHQKLGTIANDCFVPMNYKIGQRSQDLQPLYFENGLLYICKAEAIVKGTLISKDAFPHIVDHPFAAVDIDTQADFDYAKYLIHNS